MKPPSKRLLVLLAILLGVSIPAVRKWTARPAPPLIPLPEAVDFDRGSMRFDSGTRIYAVKGAERPAQLLPRTLRKVCNWQVAVQKERPSRKTSADSSTFVSFELDENERNAEGYKLRISPESTVITARTEAGFFYGLQTFLQLFPPSVYGETKVETNAFLLPCLKIEDAPRFPWRGFMLDVARHFFGTQELKRGLDSMAMHKLNRFHLHLTDDQGWRLEVKAYPRLTEVGAWRSGIGFRLDPASSKEYGPDGRYGGYYTQQDIQDLVAYAEALHITIVPEIEMPGHATAALTAYPNLSCFGGAFTTDVNAGVFDSIFCAGKEDTFEFIENVIREVVPLFPGPFIHIGGDEVPMENWRNCPRCQQRVQQQNLANVEELQAYFIRRVAAILEKYDRRLVGWSEIRDGGLPRSAVVMDWIGGGLESAREGHDVISSPFGFAYFDHYQSTNRANEPRALGGFLPWEKVYAFEPIPIELERQFHVHILGPQANLWTEYVPSFAHVQYMMFPRLCAMAEVGWSPAELRDPRDFARRLDFHLQRLKAMDIRYREPALLESKPNRDSSK